LGLGLTTLPRKKQIITISEKGNSRTDLFEMERKTIKGFENYIIECTVSILRWGDSVDHGIRILGEKNWRNLALNRE
jgi:hypothetical protein